MKRNLYPLCAFWLIVVSTEISAAKFPFGSFSEPGNFRTYSVAKPANNASNVSAPFLKITANLVSGASSYTIEINTSPDFTGRSIIQSSIQDNQRTLSFSGLDYATTYYARVKTDVSNEYRKVSRFTTIQEQFPVILEPSGATELNPMVIKVVVSPLRDAKHYSIELNTKKNFSGASFQLSGVGTDFIFRNLDHSTTYYARAISDISTTYGPVTSFTTRAKINAKRLWGLSTAGGQNNSGTVFSFSTDSATFTKHHDYQEASDYPTAYLRGALTPAPDGGFYGMSECERNGTCANGEVFYISPEGRFELRYTLGVHAGSLMLASNNSLYVVDDWTNLFRGGVWRLNPDSMATYPLENLLFKFSKPTQGLNPHTRLLEINDGFLYGVAPYGGKNNAGTIFRLSLNGKQFEVLHHFDPAISGGNPNGSLTMGDDGYLYGTTALGGPTNHGTLFKILPDGNGFTIFYEFSGLNGRHPMGDLLHDGEVLYGMTSEGGNADKGVMFTVKTDGSLFRKLVDFDGNNGAHPRGTPTMDDKNMLYAMTAQGGNRDMGVIFKIKSNGYAYSKLFDFTENSGGNPDGNLLIMDDSFRRPNTIKAISLSNFSQKVGLFPNPFVSSFVASIETEKQENVKFIITNLQGDVLHEAISMTNSGYELGSELGRGIYILKVIKGEEVSLHRIVKK